MSRQLIATLHVGSHDAYFEVHRGVPIIGHVPRVSPNQPHMDRPVPELETLVRETVEYSLERVEGFLPAGTTDVEIVDGPDGWSRYYGYFIPSTNDTQD